MSQQELAPANLTDSAGPKNVSMKSIKRPPFFLMSERRSALARKVISLIFEMNSVSFGSSRVNPSTGPPHPMPRTMILKTWPDELLARRLSNCDCALSVIVIIYPLLSINTVSKNNSKECSFIEGKLRSEVCCNCCCVMLRATGSCKWNLLFKEHSHT